jgi:uncharacterized protein (DUF983 family)
MGEGEISPSFLECKCPRCGVGDLYVAPLSLKLHTLCPACGLDYAGGDAADGPAVFLIFLLGFTIVPAALFVELRFEPPWWVHVVLWVPAVFLLTISFLRPVKSYMLALAYKHRKEDME